MLVKIKILKPELTSRDYYLDTNKFVVKTNDLEELIECSKKARFNTLSSLFALKKDWVSEEVDEGNYFIYFEDNLTKSLYIFKDNLPSNFGIFMLYLTRLEVSEYE